MEDYILNEHHKEEFPPAHTAEHLLNQTMIRLFGCERSYNAHIERKKSKMSFYVDHKPTRQEEREIERQMNELIEQDLPVTFEFVTRDELPEEVSADRLPDDASDTIRLVRIGLHKGTPFNRNMLLFCIAAVLFAGIIDSNYIMKATTWMFLASVYIYVDSRYNRSIV